MVEIFKKIFYFVKNVSARHKRGSFFPLLEEGKKVWLSLIFSKNNSLEKKFFFLLIIDFSFFSSFLQRRTKESLIIKRWIISKQIESYSIREGSHCSKSKSSKNKFSGKCNLSCVVQWFSTLEARRPTKD